MPFSRQYVRAFFHVFPSRSITLLPWLVLFLFVSALEFFGIAFIAPFISLAENPDLLREIAVLNALFELSRIETINHFTAFIGLLIAILFAAKSLIAWLSQSYIFKFSYLQKEKLIKQLISAYLSAPYSLFLKKNTSQVIHNIRNQTATFSDAILSTLLNLVSNAITVLVLTILLYLTAPIAMISLALVSASLIVIFLLAKNKMRLLGRELFESSEGIIRGVNHSLGGIKEVKVLGCGEYFEKETTKEARRLADASFKFYSLKLAPRFIIETLLVISVIGIVSTNLIFQPDSKAIFSQLAVFGVASTRLIPATANLFSGIAVLQNSSYALEKLSLDLKELQENPDKELSLSNTKNHSISFSSPLSEINITKLSYRYPGTDKKVLDDISFTIKKGESVAIIGKSGSGKSTLVNTILGLLKPQSGDILVDGKSVYSNIRDWQNLIGYIPQTIFLIDDTIEKNIAFGIPDELIDQQKLSDAITQAHLSDYVQELPEGVNTRVGERGVMLSGGQRQRIGIARALYHDREILVLDEATSALDTDTERKVAQAIKSLKGSRTMITIAHRLSTIEDCDRVYLIDKGTIIKSGSYAEVAC